MREHIIHNQKNSFFNSNLTFQLIIANIIFFVVFTLLVFYLNPQNPEVIYNYIAIKPSNILHGQYLWTFISSMFMHAGFFHLLANMLSLMFIGSLVERLIGKRRYFWLYMFSGIFAGVFFVLSAFLFPNDMKTFAVGASGALFGLVGFLMLITPNLPVYILFIPLPIKMKYAGVGILVALWGISLVGNLPVGNTAHLGGLITGIVYGVYIRTKYKRKSRLISQYFS